MRHTRVGKEGNALEVATVRHECEAKYLEHQKTHGFHYGKGVFAAKEKHHLQQPDYEYRARGCPQPMDCGSDRMTWDGFERPAARKREMQRRLPVAETNNAG